MVFGSRCWFTVDYYFPNTFFDDIVYYLIFERLLRPSAIFYTANVIDMPISLSRKLKILTILGLGVLNNNDDYPVMCKDGHFTHMKKTLALLHHSLK